MLRGTWALRDVVDVESLCRGVLADAMRKQALSFERADYDEMLAHLLSQVVIEEIKFVAKGFDRRPGYLFRPWLYVQLRSRLIDFVRFWFGRKGERRVVDYRLAGAARDDDGDAGEDRLDGAADPRAGDYFDDRVATCGGLLSVGDR